MFELFFCGPSRKPAKIVAKAHALEYISTQCENIVQNNCTFENKKGKKQNKNGITKLLYKSG